MNVLLWVCQWLLALALAGFGMARLARSRQRVVSAFPYLEPYPGPAIKALGLLEVMAGLGLVLPGATGIAPVLVGWAALGGLALAVGGTVVHLRRRETQSATINTLFIAVLILIAWGRFGPYHL